MTPITRDDIEELERKAKVATEGPWFPHDFTEAPSDSPPSAHDVAVSCTTPDHILVASMGGGLWGPRGDAGILQAKLDADYIAAACPRTTLRLIARIREFEGENAKLREAIRDAGWSVMQTSGKWSIHCVTEKAKRAEEVEARVIAENVDLMRRVGELGAALRPFAKFSDGWNPNWPDFLGWDEIDKDIVPTLGDCRIAAAVLAKGEANAS